MLKRRVSTLAATAATAVVGAGLLLAPATPAAAAIPCRSSGNLKTINGTDPNWHWPPYGSTYTTANCNDINVKITRTVQVQTCFAPSSGGYYCNGYRTVYANTWGLAATDVADGTRFWLLFNSENIQGVAAY